MRHVVCLVVVLVVVGLAYGQAAPVVGTPGLSGVARVDLWQTRATVLSTSLCEGLSPGFWKNHPEAWGPTGYTPCVTVGSVFPQVATCFPCLADDTLMEALNYPGGPGAEGAARILLRAAVAALLNAAHPNLNFPDCPDSVILNTNSAIASKDRQTMLNLAAYWDLENNYGGSLW